MSGPLRFDYQFGRSSGSQPRRPEDPMRILVIGNFAGRDQREVGTTLAKRPIHAVDVDNFDDLLGQVCPAARIPLGDHSEEIVEVKFADLEHFHPDHLFGTLPIFEQLRDLRKRLLDPGKFADAAAELSQIVPPAPRDNTAAPDPASDPASSNESDTDTIERILGSPAAVASDGQRQSPASNLTELIGQIVAPHIVAGPDPRQDQLVQSVDAAISAQMRSILRDHSFRSIEASWRGLHNLISNVETSEELQVYCWDATVSELLQLSGSDSGQLEDSVLFRRLVGAREEEPWSLIVSDASFSDREQDLTLLGRLGAIASRAGGPLIAAASPRLLGIDSWDPGSAAAATAEVENWETLRSSSVAAWIGLTAPQVILRLPYGSATDPIDSFPFEELVDPQTDHQGLLWGTAAIAGATLLANSFSASGWQMSPDDHLQLADLPAVTYNVDGQSQLQPCGECLLAERAAESLLADGLIPVMSFRNRNAIRLLRFQSIARPASALAGPWS